MLKIKDNVDLKELEKFGFIYGFNDSCNPKYEWYELDEHYQTYAVTVKEIKELEIIVGRDYGMNADTLYDLIKAGIIEKVDE